MKSNETKSLALIGFVVGAVAGFITRPSVPMVGQLPFKTVMTRGAFLKGWDRVMVSSAKHAFNHVALFAVLGIALGLAVPAVIRLAKE